jgi:predicted TIM-barrel fold metal-dependent hydrolase
MMGHVTSMIIAGAFDLFPNLQVMLVGGGAAWVPSFLWRMDDQFKLTRKLEAPWLQALPSEYFARHVRLATYGLESPRQAGRLAQVLETIPGAESMFLYASGYPRRDWEEPGPVLERLPSGWADSVRSDAARTFFRWPDRPARDPELALDLDVVRDRVGT